MLTSLLNAINIGQVYLQISVHCLHRETFQRLTVFQLELDDVSRERHEEVIDVSRMSESGREVRAAMFFRSKSGYSRWNCGSSLRKYLRRVVKHYMLFSSSLFTVALSPPIVK